MQISLTWWIALVTVVAVMLAIDLWAYRGRPAESRRRTLTWTIIWIAAGLIFGAFVWASLGARAAHEYYAAYAIEKALSLDNVFLFYVIFQSLNVPSKFQHKVLFWGILGAIVFRGVFIFLGVAAIERWHWISYVFALVLLYAAWQAFRKDPAAQEENRTVKWLSRHIPMKEDIEHGRFVERKDGGRAATPLLVALLAIEASDVMFAIDSVPAALAITRNRFLVYSANIFAVLGLRALYLFLSATIVRLRYLHYGLAAVLAFAAIKILADEWLPIPPLVSIGIIVVFIGVAVWASLRAREKPAQHAAKDADSGT
ncbi:MAG TPA: TerC/Alx family metal homeostasis membrane protein [Candidatus Eisenbacteria bacterium]|nr:TerC/Alx family metal homeostasis membrane protein [Candidatus Eisenbacteria bacterium]